MLRKTYAIIDGEQLQKNIKEIKKTYNNYEYYIGVVKNNAYHHGIKCINDLIKGGINYLAVSSLEEAIEIRKYNLEIPVLCLEPIDLEFIYDAMNNNITITIDNLDYLKDLSKFDIKYDLKIHLALDTGMHRIGLDNNRDIKEAIKLINNHKHLILEGIYSHFATSGVTDPYYDKQVNKFLELTKDIDLKNIPIVHMGRSLSLVQHEKLPFCNGIRLGIVMFGFSQSRKPDNSLRGKLSSFKRKRLQKKYNLSETTLTNHLKVSPAMSLYSTIMSVRKVNEGDTVGYGGAIIEEDGYIYTLPIGYADGVTKDFDYCLINKEECKIVADCMDMILVFSKNKYRRGEKVEIFGPNRSITNVTSALGINAYHLFNQISNRVVRVHVNKEQKEEIKY